MREKILEFFEFLRSKASEEKGELIIKSPSRFWKEANLSNRRQAYYLIKLLSERGLLKRVEGTKKYTFAFPEKINLTLLEKEIFISLPTLAYETPYGLRIKEADIPLPQKRKEVFLGKLEEKGILERKLKTEQGLVWELNFQKFSLFSKRIEIVEEKVEKRIKTKEEIQAEIARLEREIERLKWVLENYELLIKEISE